MPHLAMVFGLIGMGCGIWPIPMVIFDVLNISFLGEYGARWSGAIVGLSLAILLVGQYFWRQRLKASIEAKTHTHSGLKSILNASKSKINLVLQTLFSFKNGYKPQATEQKYPNQNQKKPENGSQVKPTIISLILLVFGLILPFAIVYLLEDVFNYGKPVVGNRIIMVCLFYALLVGQYLWRHRQTMPHLAMVFGLIGIGCEIWFISVVIFHVLDISFLGEYGERGSGAIVGLSLAILLVGQDFWRQRLKAVGCWLGRFLHWR